jgi:predicted nucleic acid-binding protein
MRIVLDACVLYPSVLREILKGVAQAGLYEPIFSERILGEWTRATAKLGPVAMAEAEGAAALWRAAFPGGLRSLRPEVSARLRLPDPDDVHVLSLAISSHADAIVTFNAEDFPRPLLADEGIERRDPDGFLWELWSGAPEKVGAVVARVHAEAEARGGPIARRKLLKKGQLWRLAKALEG